MANSYSGPLRHMGCHRCFFDSFNAIHTALVLANTTQHNPVSNLSKVAWQTTHPYERHLAKINTCSVILQ